MLDDALRECAKHLQYMNSALQGLAVFRPLTRGRYETLGNAEIKDLDQFILRFTKLQDAVGSRLFAAVLSVMQEPYQDWPMIDRLNRLEKLGFLESAADWETIREARNKLAHEYPDDPEKNAETLNLSFDAATRLENVIQKLVVVLRGRGIPLNVPGLPTA